MGLKIALLLVKSVFINLGEGMSELWHWLAAKYTTLEILILLKGWTGTKNFYDSWFKIHMNHVISSSCSCDTFSQNFLH